FTQPINDWGVAPPKAPVDFALQRVTVAPGAAMRLSPAAGMKLIAVESGAVAIDWSQPIDDALRGPGAASSAARSNAPNQLTTDHWVDIAQRHQYAARLRNAGSEPLVMLVLTAAAANGAQAAPAAMVAAP
ncbi:MAG TPA: hypothetical protein VFU81_03940, partial [Thermomicrobiales bacterium]|nr:hypothetical protein [Thermomicrobiales bacterium]